MDYIYIYIYIYISVHYTCRTLPRMIPRFLFQFQIGAAVLAVFEIQPVRTDHTLLRIANNNW